MMPFVLFGSRSFVGLTMLTLLLYGALGALFVLLPFAMMRVGGVPAADAGGALMPTIILIAVLSPPLGGLAGRIGPRPLLVYGSMIVAGGLLMLLRVDVGSSYWTGLFPAFCLVGLGLAGAVAPLTTAVMASVKPSATGTESGYNSVIAPDRPHSANVRQICFSPRSSKTYQSMPRRWRLRLAWSMTIKTTRVHRHLHCDCR